MARTETDAAMLGIAYLGVKDIFSTDNSSPQTTEINAKHRVATLMKWVNIATVESVGLVFVLMSAAPRGHKKWPVIGGLLGLVVTYSMYLYAKMCGTQSSEPPTEDFTYQSNQRRGPSTTRPARPPR